MTDNNSVNDDRWEGMEEDPDERLHGLSSDSCQSDDEGNMVASSEKQDALGSASGINRLNQEDVGNDDHCNNNNDDDIEQHKKKLADQEKNTADNGDNHYMTTLKAELESKVIDSDYTEFVIRIIKRTVRQEDSLVRQIFYTGLSKNSANPLNLAVLAPTSEGKTYPVLESLQFFPKEHI